jgi:hypothetical protein
MTNPLNRVEIQGNTETLRQRPGQEDALVERPLPEPFGMERDGQDALEGIGRVEPLEMIRHVVAQGSSHRGLTAEFHAQDRFSDIPGIDSDRANGDRSGSVRVP